MAANTITGTVERVELIGHSHYGNPYYNVGIHADGEAQILRTSIDAGVNYEISNHVKSGQRVTFALTRAGRISHVAK